MSNTTHTIEFIASGRGKARCAPNPDFPNGIDIDPFGPVIECCKVNLRYPAPECGVFLVRCKLCKTSVMITAAGRPDDPKSVRIQCQIEKEKTKNATV